jgi:hypothetical protein
VARPPPSILHTAATRQGLAHILITGAGVPAQFTRTSTRPKVEVTVAAVRSIDAASPTSHSNPMCGVPVDGREARKALSVACERLTTTTEQPWCANRLAAAFPIPRAPPVINTTRAAAAVMAQSAAQVRKRKKSQRRSPSRFVRVHASFEAVVYCPFLVPCFCTDGVNGPGVV